MKFGFARLDITPPLGTSLSGYLSDRPAEGIVDPLQAHAIAFSDGEKTAAVVSLDIIGMRQLEMDEVRKRAAQKNNIEYEAVFIHCTHTHTGPELNEGRYCRVDKSYKEYVFNRISDAITLAIADMKDGTVEAAVGEAKDVARIRRYRMKDGSVRTNPYGSPDILEPLGVPDDDVQLVKIIRENAPDIVIVNFQVHPDSVGGSKIFSDFPVFVRRVLEGALRDEKNGMGVYVVYFNGTQGDTNNSLMVGTLPRDMRKPMNIGRRLAGAALSVYTYAEPMKADKVYYGQKTVNVEVNKGTPEQLAHAKEILKMDEERHDEFIEKYPGMEGTTAITEAKTWLNNESEPDNHGLYVTSVGFGDVAFVGFPGEPFTEIGRQLKKQSQFKMTIPCCCANGYQAYFPTVNAFEEGGYEIRSSRYKKGTAEKLLEAGIELTKRFKE